VVGVTADRAGNHFQCPRCSGDAGYHFDAPFCAIDGDWLVYLGHCPRCGLVKYRSPLLRAGLACPTCLGELVLTTTWDTPHRTAPAPYFCPRCLELAEAGLRPTSRRARNAVAKMWRGDRRLYELRIHLGRFGEDPRFAQANLHRAERQHRRRRKRVASAFKAIGDDNDVVRGVGSDG